MCHDLYHEVVENLQKQLNRFHPLEEKSFRLALLFPDPVFLRLCDGILSSS